MLSTLTTRSRNAEGGSPIGLCSRDARTRRPAARALEQRAGLGKDKSFLLDRLDADDAGVRRARPVAASAADRMGDGACHLDGSRRSAVPAAPGWRVLGVRCGQVGLPAVRLLSGRGTLAHRCRRGDRSLPDRLAALAECAAPRLGRAAVLRRLSDPRISSSFGAPERSVCLSSTRCCGEAYSSPC